MVQNVEAWTLLSLALTTILVRVFVRWKLVGPANFQLDDYLMPLAGIFFTLETVAAYLVGAKFDGLTNSYMTPEQRASLSPDSTEWANRVAGSKIQVIGWSLYVAILWLVKFALTVFYSRLTTGLQHLPTRVRLAYIILGVTYVATQLSLLLSCQPFHAFWQIYPDPGNFCQPANSRVYVLLVVILNVVTDIYLLSIPLPLLWQVKIGLKRKIPLMALFSGAMFVITAAIIRAVMIMTSGAEGAVSGSQWACRETFVSVVVSNLPIIQPLIRKGFKKIGLSQLFSSSGKPSGQSYPLSSRGLQTLTSRAERSTKRSKNAGPTHTQVSAWGSDEHILELESTSKDITVVSETIVRSEPWATKEGEGADHAATSPKEWDGRLSAR
ncbi:putative srpk [Penicillium brasilianum]|uniref:Putative srpk n=1 Tax=Penicillium brasilianum TaxID=104259 RepID=A0A1S9RCN6_PENBI|nr:putative srpk [Penicillium brasilianum]